MGESLGFDDVCPRLAPFYAFIIMPELTKLQGNSPSFREEVVLFGVVLLHSHQAQSEEVFAGQDVNAWKMVDLLVKIHTKKSVWLYFSVGPPDVPISRTFYFLYNPS